MLCFVQLSSLIFCHYEPWVVPCSDPILLSRSPWQKALLVAAVTQCIVLAKNSIRLAREIVNLSKGCPEWSDIQVRRKQERNWKACSHGTCQWHWGLNPSHWLKLGGRSHLQVTGSGTYGVNLSSRAKKLAIKVMNLKQLLPMPHPSPSHESQAGPDSLAVAA